MAHCNNCDCNLADNYKSDLCMDCEREYQLPHKMKTKSTAIDPLSYNVGSSNYSSKKIQPYDIWEEYELNPWDADIVKRILRTKKIEGMTADEARIEDYEKIIHICQYRIAKLKGEL